MAWNAIFSLPVAIFIAGYVVYAINAGKIYSRPHSVVFRDDPMLFSATVLLYVVMSALLFFFSLGYLGLIAV